ASVDYWGVIAERHGLDLTVVNPLVDATWRFMTLDWDGKIRMDCSSPHAMAGLIGMKDRFDLAVGNDPDADRHGIVTPAGLMNPNHYLAAAIDWLLESRDRWNPAAAIGKTAVTSALVDRVAAARGRAVFETPVGLKWFVAGLSAGDLAFAGEESAGATFVRFDGTVWTTDKDGILLGLLAAEMTAKGGEDPHARYRRLTATLGEPFYARTDAPATAAQKAAFKALDPATMPATLAGDPVTRVETRARGNDAPLGGVKVSSERGWFAARPSGTEDVVKVYAESFVGAEHLAAVQADAQAVLAALTP
ncbi:MAG: alpha-D-glucose phosphate-specific phosphoglucomutase, partial [Sphingomonadaceae bacterium]|nr:alpha-D-glucose phosphate-specific phosphoglucomutase [Sphingomonadaceae bacterium]